MSATYTVAVRCPKCGWDISVPVTFSGRDADYTTPEGHMGCDPFTSREIDVLYDKIEEAAQEKYYAENGPDEPDYNAVSAAERHELDVREYVRRGGR
jgi:hypothetical protein